MGLAASQGRLLLLTARKSDLEFRAQQISQARLVLAQQQETISKAYAEKTANTCLKMRVPNANGEMEFIDFTAGNIMAAIRAGSIRYRFVDQNDNEVISATGQNVASNPRIRAALNADRGGADSALKYLLESGAIRIQRPEGNDWVDTSVAGEANISEQYFTEDDAAAKAKYDADMLKVKVKDQQLELDLKGIESQHKAVETEFESVQKVIQKNIEVSFKIFS